MSATVEVYHLNKGETPETKLMSLSQASDECVPQTLPTVWRWATEGLRAGSETIVLQTKEVGGRRFTTKVWVEEFLIAFSEAKARAKAKPTVRSEAARLRMKEKGLA